MTEERILPVAIYQVDCNNYGSAAFDDIVDDIVRQINKKTSELGSMISLGRKLFSWR
jgi:hypothetical protein